MIQVKFPLPTFSAEEATKIAATYYGLNGTAHRLPSERDQNFLIRATQGEFVLKISNVLEEHATLDLQNQALIRLAGRVPELHVPRLCGTTAGETIVRVVRETSHHYVRLLTYVPARLLAEVKPRTPELLRSVGQVLATINAALLDFEHPAAERDLKWDVARADWIGEYLHYIDDDWRKSVVERYLHAFETRTKPALAALRKTVIYNDANDHNVLVSEDGKRAIGVIDFGDMVHSNTINELAVGIPYAVFGKADWLSAACEVVAGYNQVLPLSEDELALLFPLICARMCISVTNSAYQRRVEPDNPYLQISEDAAWTLLKNLLETNPKLAHYRFRYACGLPAVAHQPKIVTWLTSNPDQVQCPLDIDLSANSTLIDLSVGNTTFGTLGEITDTLTLSALIFSAMHQAQADVGIGRYNEARVLSTGSSFQIQGNDGPEWRTIHLGVDLFTNPGTQVFAALDGVVHSFQNNAAAPFDFGPTVVLQHNVNHDQLTFFTFYGHLSRSSLERLKPDQRLTKGDLIGTVGESSENGGWPPHLHFQIIADMLGMEGDYPGNAVPSQREFWSQLCPDPNLILNLPTTFFQKETKDLDQLLRSREQHLHASLSLSYREPLHIVRGWMQHLYDSNGRAYLDSVNNVAHVGHCHPRVVEAGQRQMAVLNTNTRYLHENILSYAERLRQKLPQSLSVCFFVNSGSEANELAIRLARARTRQKGLIVLEGGYHGNTNQLIEVSAYKFNGPGGSGAPGYVQSVPLADGYRGPYKYDDPDAAENYAEHVRQAIAELQTSGSGLCAFLHESLPSTAGQIQLIPGYLRKSYELIRSAGGVCIADEVQTGFGRLGSYFWGFESHNVVPDIITLGKPMGNGHPLGAVITTSDIAESFQTGMEFFSTFGGNPVSCAIGLAVLDVLEQQQLMRHAQDVGSHLLHGLRNLKKTHPIMGDVRGSGFYIGVELVRDDAALEPAADQASYIVNRMKECGVLISRDGVLHNVLKIRPPMIFQRTDAEFFLSTIATILQEDGAQA